jgi:hypothetical protein
VARDEFSPWDAVAAELRFERNGEPIVFRLEWTAPGGQRWTGEDVRVPFGCVTAWSALEAPGPLAVGAWRVTARSPAARLAEARFTVRPAGGEAGRAGGLSSSRDSR